MALTCPCASTSPATLYGSICCFCGCSASAALLAAILSLQSIFNQFVRNNTTASEVIQSLARPSKGVSSTHPPSGEIDCSCVTPPSPRRRRRPNPSPDPNANPSRPGSMWSRSLSRDISPNCMLTFRSPSSSRTIVRHLSPPLRGGMSRPPLFDRPHHHHQRHHHNSPIW